MSKAIRQPLTGGRIAAALAAAAVGLTLAIPAQAGPKFSDNAYEGRAERDPYTYFGFDVVTRDGKKRVANVTARLAYSCAGGSGGRATARARGKLPIDDGHFAGKLSVPEDQIPVRARGVTGSMTYDVAGELRPRGRARGTIDAVIRFSAAPRGGGSRCYSGKLDWRAKRGAEVEPITGP